MSTEEVGSKWRFVGKDGSIGTVWLAERQNSFEVWRWSFFYSDGSGHKFDWCRTRRNAVFECSCKFREKTRFKKIIQNKQSNDT
jgi:hypothetical protein